VGVGQKNSRKLSKKNSKNKYSKIPALRQNCIEGVLFFLVWILRAHQRIQEDKEKIFTFDVENSRFSSFLLTLVVNSPQIDSVIWSPSLFQSTS